MNPHFLKALILLITTIFAFNIKEAAAGGYINLSEKETIIKSIPNGDRLWFLTRDEVGYYVGSTRVIIPELSNISHLNLNFIIHNNAVYLFAVDGVAKYDIDEGEISTLVKVTYRGRETPLTYAISPQIYNKMLYFGWKNRIIETDLNLQNQRIIEAPPTKLSVNELYALSETDYERKSLSSITSFIILNDVFYIMTRRGSLMSFKDDGGNSVSTYLLGRHEIPSLDNSFTYEIHHDSLSNKLIIATTVGAVFFDLKSQTGGNIPEATNGRILRVARVDDNKVMLLGKEILYYDPVNNITTKVYGDFPYNYITSYTELNGVKYFSTEFDGIVIDRGEGFFEKMNTSGSNSIELVMFNDNGDLAYLLESVIIYKGKRILLPDSSNGIKIYSYKGERLIISDWFELYSINSDGLEKISHPFENDTITDISLIDEEKLLITYKENTAQIFNFDTKEYSEAAEYFGYRSLPAVDELFRYSENSNFSIKTKRASDIEVNLPSGETTIIKIPDDKYYLLESIQEQGNYFILNYSPSLSILIDKLTAKHQILLGQLKGHRCSALFGNRFIEVGQKGAMYLTDITTKSVKKIKLNELVTLNNDIVFHPSCSQDDTLSEILISTSDGAYSIEIDKLSSYERPVGQPYIPDSSRKNIILPRATNTINTTVVSTYPAINTDISLLTDANGNVKSFALENGLAAKVFIEGLRPGITNLDLRFVTKEGGRELASTEYNITNNVPFYQERYFLLVYLAFTCIFLYLSFIFIKKQQEKRATIEIARSKERSLNTIAHDIKAPLTAIFAAKEMVKQGSLKKSDAYEALLPNVQILQYISTNLLSINELNQKGALSINRSGFDAMSFLSTTIQASKTIADTKNISINFCNTLKHNDYLVGDIGKITQSVLNVISNAVKYSSHNSVIDISSNYIVTSKELEVIIQDYGKGVPKEDLAKITNIHEQASNSLKDGQGLGLYIASEICKAHGGCIDFKSELDVGTRVRMSFICHESSTEELATVAAPKMNGSTTRHKMYMLEDDEIQARFFTSVMHEKGVEVTNFIEIDDFINAIENDKPDAVITDHMIGHSHINQTGLDVVKQIRKQNKNISIIAMTDQVDVKIRESYEKLGCLYISKNASTIDQDTDLIIKQLDD